MASSVRFVCRLVFFSIEFVEIDFWSMNVSVNVFVALLSLTPRYLQFLDGNILFPILSSLQLAPQEH